jgi:hypothetical protein
MKKLSALLFNQGGKCFYCDAVLDIDEATIDHVVPQSKGGANDLENLVVCCKYANQAFRDYSPKQKMTVIKQLACLTSICQKIFLREEQLTELKEVENVPLMETRQAEDNAHKTRTTPRKNAKTKQDVSIAYQLLLQAIELFETEDREAVSSRIKKRMLELNPSFQESDYGFSQFKKFLLHAEEENIVILKKHKTSNNYILRKCS